MQLEISINYQFDIKSNTKLILNEELFVVPRREEAPSEWQQVIINLPAELLISHAKTQRAASTVTPGGNEELCQHPLPVDISII